MTEQTDAGVARLPHKGRRGKAFDINCSDEKKNSILNLLWWAETQRQKHRLSHEFFSQRWTWWMSLPISALAFIMGVLSFLSASEMLENNDKARNILGLVAGCLGFLTSFYNVVQGALKWDSSSQMHKSAARQLEKIWFRLWELADSLSPEESTDLESNISTLSNAIIEIDDSCTAVHPFNIHEAFALMEVRLNVIINRDASVDEDTEMAKLYPTNTELHIRAATELAAVISEYKVTFFGCRTCVGFPFFTPPPTVAVEETMGRIVVVKTSNSTTENAAVPLSCELVEPTHDPLEKK